MCTFSSVDSHSLHAFQQQVLVDGIDVGLLLREYQHLTINIERVFMVTTVRSSNIYISYLTGEVLTGGVVFWRHSSRYTIFASSLTYSTSCSGTQTM